MKLSIGLGLDKYRPKLDQAGILDDYPPFAVWALSYFVSSYSGDVVLVRRSSDNAEQGFTPTEITDGTLTTWVGGGNDGFVKTVYDQIGVNHAVQNTTTAQMKIVDSGALVTNSDNGLPALLGSTTGIWGFSVTFSSSLSQPTTKFTIGKPTGAGANMIFSGSPNASARHQLTYLTSNGGELSLFAGSSFTPSAVTSLFNTTWLAYSLFNGASSQLGVNGNSANTGNAGAHINDGYTLPISSGIRGYWQFEALYDSNQSANRTAIETAINSYFSIY